MRLPAALTAALFSFSTPTAALAAPPKVVVDIAPVHALVAQVMGTLGSPVLLIEQNMDPHYVTLKPSQARALEEAEMLVWIGPEMTPWLEKGRTSLAPEATNLGLLALEDTIKLELREGDAHDGHDHGDGPDPHAWLDPANAQVWVRAIAQALSEADPENSAQYLANAKAAGVELAALESRLDAQLSDLRGKPFVVMHDAYQYLESRFELSMAAAVGPSDNRAVGAARLFEVSSLVDEKGVVCVFSEPGVRLRMMSILTRGDKIRSEELDQMGRGIEPGPDHYLKTMTAMGDALETCLSE